MSLVAHSTSRDPDQAAQPVTYSLTVILPLYNEADVLPAALDVVATYRAVRPEVRFLFVSDGSTDATPAVLRQRLGERQGVPGSAGIGYIAYEHNAGKGEAIRTGIRAVTEWEAARATPGGQPGGFDPAPPGVRGDLSDAARRASPAAQGAVQAAGFSPEAQAPTCDTQPEHLVVFMDGDMAYGLDHLDEMTLALRTHDVVIGSRRESPEERRNTRKFRRLSGWCFNRLVRLGLSLPYQDTQAGLKGFRLSAARAIFERVTLSGFAFDVEVLFIARRLGYSIAEIPARVARAASRSSPA